VGISAKGEGYYGQRKSLKKVSMPRGIYGAGALLLLLLNSIITPHGLQTLHYLIIINYSCDYCIKQKIYVGSNSKYVV